MFDMFSTNATIAKARAIYGKRLTPEDYRELMHKNSVAEIAEYLKRNTHYRDVLSSIETSTIHRGFLETILKRWNFDLYVKLCSFQHLDEIPFYNYLVVKNEVSEIVSAILHLNAKESDDYISSLPGYFIKHASFDLIELARARDYGEILKVIKNTPYYNIIKDFTPDEDGLYDCTMIESRLRTYYLKAVAEQIKKDFPKKTADALMSLIKTQLDLINIINGYRLKAFSNADAETIEEYSLKFYGRLSKSAQHELYSASDADDYIKRLQKTYYGRQLERLGEPLTRDMLEKQLHVLRVKYAKLALRQIQSAPVSLYTIVYLFEVEVYNIISIIEGIRYKAPMSYVEKLLII